MRAQMESLWLMHYGKSKLDGAPGRGSGRYPLGSGEDSYQDYPNKKDTKEAAKKIKGIDKSIASTGGRDQLTQEHTVPKGTAIYRTTSGENGEVTGGEMYVSYLNSDRNHYKGGYIRQRDNSKTAYEHEYVLTKDLKVPSRETLKKVILDAANKNQKTIERMVRSRMNFLMPENSWDRIQMGYDNDGNYSESTLKKNWEKFVQDSIKAYKDMPPQQMYFYVAQTFGGDQQLRKDVIGALKKQGYNAMTDEASVGGQNGWAKEGSDPLIVFDSSVLEKKSTKAIGSGEEKKSRKEYEKWQRSVSSKKGAAWSAV